MTVRWHRIGLPLLLLSTAEPLVRSQNAEDAAEILAISAGRDRLPKRLVEPGRRPLGPSDARRTLAAAEPPTPQQRVLFPKSVYLSVPRE